MKVLDIRIDLRDSGLFPSSEDRFSLILPRHEGIIPFNLIFLPLKPDRSGDVDQVIAGACQPVDPGEGTEHHLYFWYTELEFPGNVAFELLAGGLISDNKGSCPLCCNRAGNQPDSPKMDGHIVIEIVLYPKHKSLRQCVQPRGG